jgi:hypothetical protein
LLAYQKCVEPEMPGPASKAVMSDAARPNVIEMHRCLRDKDEQLLNAQQEISRIRREHATELASTRHDSESMATQAFQLLLLSRNCRKRASLLLLHRQTRSQDHTHMRWRISDGRC